MSMDFVALDFETANPKRHSACALGAVVVKNSQIVEKKYWLIRPPELYFSPFNIAVHGLTAFDVKDAPTFEEIYNELDILLKDTILIAHNAAFDMGVLRDSLLYYDIAPPREDYLCTVSLSRKLWKDLPNHKLNTMADYLQVSDFQHHNAMDDSMACAHIALEAAKLTQMDCLYDIADAYKIKIKQLC